MLERYSARALQTMTNAQGTAYVMGHPHVGTEHVLLVLAKDGQSLAGKALAELAVDPDALRVLVEDAAPRAKPDPHRHMPLTQDAKGALVNAANEAQDGQCDAVGTAHLLRAILRDTGTAAARLLARIDITVDKVRTALATCEQRGESDPPDSADVRTTVVTYTAAAVKDDALLRPTIAADPSRTQ